MAFSITESDTSQKYNLLELVKYFKKFYLLVVEVEIDEEAFGLKDYLIFKEESELIEISELIAGIAAQCVNKEYYLEIMQNDLLEDDQKVMFNILDQIIAKNDKNSNDECLHEDKACLFIKTELIEIENKNLKISNDSYLKKIHELAITHHKLEQNFYDLEQKYNEIFMVTSFWVVNL